MAYGIGNVRGRMVVTMLVAVAAVALAGEPWLYLGPRVDVGIVVRDMGESLRFYRDALGFTVLAEEEHGQEPLAGLEGARVAVLALEGTEQATRVRLVEAPPAQEPDGVTRGYGGRYLVLQVRMPEAIVERAALAKVQPEVPLTTVEGAPRHVIYRDPDGTVLVLLAPPVEGYKVHDESRPAPPKVQPAPMEACHQPPSDAVVLFDGSDLSKWARADGSEPGWKVENGYVEVVPKAGTIQSRQEFGNCQLHVEWRVPEKATKQGQGRSNSGVFLMGRYEVQVLDSYENTTYPDGQAGAIYGQAPPLVNACRPAGQWQTFDILFLRPVFDGGGTLVRPGRMTVLHNGVAVHNNYELKGQTLWRQLAHYQPHGPKGPIMLQDHGHPVQFRNIWIRELGEEEATSRLYSPQPQQEPPAGD